MDNKIDFNKLAHDITDFYYDYDPYEFKDCYDNYESGLDDTRKTLLSSSGTKSIIYNLNEINNDLSNDDPQIKDLFDKSQLLLKSLNEYVKTFDNEINL